MKISEYAFYQSYNLKKLEVFENSQLQTIGKFNLYGSSIENLTIPSSVTNFNEGWCYGTRKLKRINVFINNNVVNIKNHNENIVLKKIKNECFDVLFLVSKTIKTIEIPPFIKVISPYSFSESIIESIIIPSSLTKISEFSFFHCKKLQKVEFKKNSQLQTIEKSAFSDSAIESISIPSSVIELKESWCCDTPKLNRIDVFINNNFVNIKNFNTNLVVGKSKITNDSFDVLLFCIL